jgi:hypothetical protein
MFDPTLQDRLATLHIRNSERDTRYLQTYRLFLNFFRNRIAVPNLLADDAKLGVVLVYTWMGRVQFNPACWDNFDRAKDALNRAAVAELSQREIEDIQSFVGDSLIATSKFLHFLDPEKYAIWDQNVAWAAYRYEHWYQYNRTDRYIGYLADLRDLPLDEPVNNQLYDVLGDVSSLRMKEFALFHLGISEPPIHSRLTSQ